MSTQRKRRQHRHPAGGSTATPFVPVSVRARHDGWTPIRQVAFVKALAACACIEEACAAVGISPRAYYDLRSRPDAGSFRQAVDAALDFGVGRLADAMLGRALNGEATPIFYKGEQVGERRRFDNRLGMFILRARAPERYGKWRDAVQATRGHPDGAARMFDYALRALDEDHRADEAGQPRPVRPPLKPEWVLDNPEEREAFEERLAAQRAEARVRRTEEQTHTYLRTLDRQTGGGFFGPDSHDDVA